MKNQKGFGVVEGLLIVVILGIIGFIGWYVLQKKSVNQPSTTESNNSVVSEPSSTQTEIKEYSNAKINLSFTYPSNWTLKEKLSNPRDLGDEGEIYVESPNGLRLYINPNYGGKGGSCDEDPSDTPHNTKNCNTLEILSKEKASAKSDVGESDSAERDVYLFRVKYTGSREGSSTPASVYTIFLSNDKEEINATEPLIGAWFDLGIITNMDKPNIDTFLEGSNLSSPDVLNSDDVKSAETILRSLQIL